MFPEVLSNGLCSLKPRVDRLAMVCDMQIGPEGELADYVFYEAVIHSHARLNLHRCGCGARPKAESPQCGRRAVTDIAGFIAYMRYCVALVSNAGALDFETQETRIVFDEQRKIAAIEPVYRNDAHKLIEECMLIANVATARFWRQRAACLVSCARGPECAEARELARLFGRIDPRITRWSKTHPRALSVTVERG